MEQVCKVGGASFNRERSPDGRQAFDAQADEEVVDSVVGAGGWGGVGLDT
jgi:hypothetical protein